MASVVPDTKNVEDITSEDTFESLINELNVMKTNMRTILQKVKYLRKNYHKRKNTNIKSGFVKPVNVSKELACFLNIREDDKVPRSVVNKRINEYIKTNNLQVEDFKQTFTIDTNLATIFNTEPGTVINYFKMQTYLKHHYPKPVTVG
jgi:chromatin remodeling complex protein RSC6